jgi:hypothetical protein
MLFGHQDDNTTMPTSAVTEPGAALDSSSLATSTADEPTAAPTTTDSATAPGAPAFDNPLADETSTPDSSQSQDASAVSSSSNDTPAAAPAAAGDLLDLKQQALGQLAPLVSHLDQTPEEKFRTTMMMIQSTDNDALLKDAFTSAQAIPDDKARAQALLDVINEINYFTQQKQ